MVHPPGMARMRVTRIGGGVYRVEHDGRNDIVYVAGPVTDRWIFWNGRVYRGDFREAGSTPSGTARASRT